MRILLVTKPHLPVVGGAQMTVHWLALALAGRGHDVSVLSVARPGERGAGAGADSSLGYPVVRLAGPGGITAALLGELAPDVAVLNGFERPANPPRLSEWASQLLHALRGVPTALYVHDARGAGLAAQVNRVAAVSRYVAELCGRGTAAIPPIVDRARYRVTTTRERALFVNPVREKGIATAIALAEARPDIPFVFQRSWRLPERFLASVRERVEGLPNVELREPSLEPGAIYRDARVLLVPSAVDEAWGRVAREAQASGIPVVAADIGGLAEAVGSGGSVVGAGGWRAALGELWDDAAAYSAAVERAELQGADPAAGSAVVAAAFERWLEPLGQPGANGYPRRMESCVLVKFGEMALKGRNRKLFVAQLKRNLRHAVGDGAELRMRAGAVAVLAEMDRDELVARTRDVIGISVVHPALIVEKSAEAAARVAVDLLRESGARTFAIRARRRDKSFRLSSHELAVVVGQAVVDELGLKVDLSKPDAEVALEVDEREIFAHTGKLRARGGLPVGVSGRAVVLLSGGIDSPVAAYRAMRRGLRCDFIHFSGEPFTGPESIYKAYAHVRVLDRFQGGSRLFVVPFGTAQRSLASAGAGRLQVMAQRRLMVRVAAALAEREKAGALVTGDSLGQVASQTLPNMAAVEEASPLPLLRPLVAFDKAEVIAEAEELGTLAISHLPDEDCCTLFASKLAETRADPAALRRLERLTDAAEATERLLGAARLVQPGDDEPLAQPPQGLAARPVAASV